MRASWLAQELLFTFEDMLGECSLVPTDKGIFNVLLDGELIYSKQDSGKFPESNKLKQLIRDKIEPDMSLGHSDI